MISTQVPRRGALSIVTRAPFASASVSHERQADPEAVVGLASRRCRPSSRARPRLASLMPGPVSRTETVTGPSMS